MSLPTRARAVVSTALAAAVTLAVAAGPAGAASGFGDVPDNTYFTEAVGWMVDEGITNGVREGCFAPEQIVTRAQIAAFLHRYESSENGEPQAGANPFFDVTADWQVDAVAWMASEGITAGTSATTFSPDDPISRGELAVLLWRYAGHPDGESTNFTDVPGWQRGAVEWMVKESITNGVDATSFDPVCDDHIGALLDAGFSYGEALCAAPYVEDIPLADITAVIDSNFSVVPDANLLEAVSNGANACLTPERINAFVITFFT